MEDLIFLQGCAGRVALSITDVTTGAPVDLSSTIGIIVTLTDETEYVFQQFSSNELPDYDPLDLSQSEGGIVIFELSEAKTELCAIGKVFLTAKITTADGRDYGVAKTKISTMAPFDLKETATHAA